MNINFFKKIAAAAVILAAACVSCKKDSPKDPETEITVVMQDVSLSGAVRDAGGNPLSGVRVSTGTLSAVTGSDGTFTFGQAGTVSSRAVVKFAKSGYFSLTRAGAAADEMYIEAVMQRRGNSAVSVQASFSAAEGKTLSVAGMEVELPASSVVKADGTAYTGTVTADMLYLDPNSSAFAGMMPGGDLAAIRDNRSEVQLVSWGMTEVSLSDAAGNPLQLKEGRRSGLTFPIPAGMESNPPATIPLWYFDDDRGIWIEEGEATLRNGVYVGEAEHFSWHNLDVPEERVTIKGTVTDCAGKPVSYVRVSVEQTAAVTTGKGEYTVYVPANTPVTLRVKSADYGNYSPEAQHRIPGKPGNTVVTQNIKLPCLQGGGGDDEGEPETPGSDDGFTVERAFVSYMVDGGEQITFTFDNFGKRLRIDLDYGTDKHAVTICNTLTGKYTVYTGGVWMDIPMKPEDMENISYPYRYYGRYTANAPNENIAGKSCRVTVFNDYDGCEVRYAGWNGLMMLSEICGEVYFIATDAGLKIPANTFTETLLIFD